MLGSQQLSELPDSSDQLDPYVLSLRRSALQAAELPAVRTFSSGFLLKFLRARDFDVELSLKVQPPLSLPHGLQNSSTQLRDQIHPETDLCGTLNKFVNDGNKVLMIITYLRAADRQCGVQQRPRGLT